MCYLLPGMLLVIWGGGEGVTLAVIVTKSESKTGKTPENAKKAETRILRLTFCPKRYSIQKVPRGTLSSLSYLTKTTSYVLCRWHVIVTKSNSYIAGVAYD